MLVLLLDFAGDFEDEDDDENKEDGPYGYFSHRPFRPPQREQAKGFGIFSQIWGASDIKEA